MSFDHLELVPALELPPQQQLVLWHLANLACKTCGLAWPGMSYLAKKTRLGEKSIGSALRELRYAGLIDTFSHSKGGRGRATEYLILPRALELAPAPCHLCAENQKTPQGRRGFGSRGDDKPLKGGGVLGHGMAIPPLSAHGNPSRETDHTVSIPTQSATASQSDPPPSASGSASPRTFDHPASEPERPRRRTPEDDRRDADEILRAITPPPAGSPKPGHP